MNRKTTHVYLAMAAMLVCTAGLTADDTQELQKSLESAVAPEPGSVSNADASATKEETRAAMQAKLSETKLTMSHTDVPLADIIEDFVKQTKLNMLVDQVALHEVGVPIKRRVTLKVQDRSAAKVLGDLLKPLNLDYVIEDEVIKVTSRKRALGEPKLIVYPVGDLLAPVGKQNQPIPVGEFLLLVDEIQSEIEPELWDDDGGVGAISIHETKNCLVVRQVESVHKQIQTFLAAKRSSGEME